ncbi:MAG: 50S ribosomal protein L10 [Parcubacteria group bacterium GW2011_GWF2_38_8]|nr:MAG: 50S ribosomal protein L10 [Parcubacteria group bacterium GW2011_GWF2_38_8]
MLQKSKKEEIIKSLEKTIKESETVVFVNFHGMSVGNETTLRRDLREQGVGYKVFRKTLLKRALKGKAMGEIPKLSGEIAVAYLSAGASVEAGPKDKIAPARGIYNFQKVYKDILNIMGGIFEGKFIQKEKMTEIAMIPDREVLYAQFVNLINSPIQRFVVVLNAIGEKKIQLET